MAAKPTVLSVLWIVQNSTEAEVSILNYINKACLRKKLSIVAVNTLANRIRESREKAGLSQAEVAKSLNVSASAVNQWEQGLSKNIKLEHFFDLAALL